MPIEKLIMKPLIQFISNNLGLIGAAIMALVAYWKISAREEHHKKAKKLVKKAVTSNMNEPLTLHPEIDPALCLGCGACTKVCPEGDILKMINHKAVLVAPSKCVGHGECERACPFQAISLVFGTKTRGMDIPRLTSNYETNVPGLYISGELGGMGLIRNAVKQGVAAAEHALEQAAKSSGSADADLFIVGAGPAGLAAGLTAVSRGRKYILIEQNSFGGTVANFPRQKVVMSYPLDLPVVGRLKFNGNKVSKEELLAAWGNAQRKSHLKVNEQEKFESLEKTGDLFQVKTSKGSYKVRKVILAMGVRGSPRRLGLPNEDLPKVTYNLLDPEQYQKKAVAVVGGGNAGVEAAQYLGKQKYGNKVTLLVRGAGFDRCNEENQNIIKKMEKAGLVQIWYNSSVKAIEVDKLIINKEGKDVEIPNDYLFVFAGAEMPHKFLMSLGVGIDKKFGEALKTS